MKTSKTQHRPKSVKTKQFRAKAKTKLIKDLKENNLFNYETISKLEYYDDIVWDNGSIQDLYSLSDRRRDTLLKKFQENVEKILLEFTEYRLLTKFREAISYNLEYFDDKNIKKMIIKMQSQILDEDFELTEDFVQEVLNLSRDSFEFSLDSKEFISVSGRTSNWTTTLTGKVILPSRIFDISFDVSSETNRI